MSSNDVFRRQCTDVSTYITDRSQVHKPRSFYSPKTIYISLLLLLGVIKSNPGPANPTAIRFRSLSTCCAVHNGALIDDLIHENRLDVLAVCDSRIQDDALDIMKNNTAPSKFSILHVHRPRATDIGLAKMDAFLCNNNLSAQPMKNKFLPTSQSFELQLACLQLNQILLKVVNIVRRQISMPKFLDESALDD